MNTNIGCHADGLYRDLVRHLDRDGVSTSVSKQFSAFVSNADRVGFAVRLLEDYNLVVEFVEDKKNDEFADEYRRKGNEFYKKKNVKEAIELYTKSIACAQIDGEMLALAFANRSAALFEKKFYKNCLKDIDRALENNYPEKLKDKLMSRKKNANDLISEDCWQPYHQNMPAVEDDNERIRCASDSVEILQTDNLGRHVVAKRDVEIGEVIAVERPFCHVLTGHYLSHCHECLSLCYSLIPCDNCTQVLYCSEDCKRNGSVYHRYECKILRTLRELQLDKMQLLPLKICLVTKSVYSTISSLSSEESNDVYLSDRYKEIHGLVGNTDSRPVGDLFKRAVNAAVIFNLVKHYTTFFNSSEEEDVFKELLLKHMQTAPCNFHSISEIAQNVDGIYESEDIAAGAFSFLSMFNHSCNPNVVRQCFGPTIVLRAIRSIQKGEQCYDNYGYHHAVMARDERRAHLKKQYFFHCDCEACQQDWPLYPDLPSTDNDFEIDQDIFAKLMNGDVECAKTVLSQVVLRIKYLEIPQPNKQFAEKQEILKQCLALLGNVRRTV